MALNEVEEDSLNTKFRFNCTKTCDKRCCKDSALQLDPCDIIPMKKTLGISSHEFLEKYTYPQIDSKSRVFVLLKMPCPFLKPEGCSIYMERPIHCRLYPIVEHFFERSFTYDFKYYLDEITNCPGLQGNSEWTVETWKRSHGLDVLDQLHKEWYEIFFSANISDKSDQAQIIVAGYDLDRFKTFVLNTGFLNIVDVEEEELHKIKKDDIALMKFGFRYLRHIFDIEKTLKIKKRDELQLKQMIRDIMCI